MPQPSTSRDSSLFRDLLGRILGEHHPGEKGGVSRRSGGFSEGYILASEAVHMDIQVVKQRLQEACMDEDGAPAKSQKGECTRGGGKHKRLDLLSMSQLFLLLKNLTTLFSTFHISFVSTPFNSKQGQSKTACQKIM